MRYTKRLVSSNNELYIFETDDGYRVESVFGKERKNLCISTQVGCKIGCVFCASGKNGFFRNLTQEEIMFQIDFVNSKHRKINAMHFAGIGEPLDNLKNVLSCARKIKGRFEKVQISTCVPSLAALSKVFYEDFNMYTISLHSLNTRTRKMLMPGSISPDLIVGLIKKSLKRAPEIKDKIYFGYMLLHGINDSERNIQELAKTAKDLGVGVYVMFHNKNTEESGYYTDERVFEMVCDLLEKNGIKYSRSTLSRKDLIGGCGTLKLNRSIY